MPYSPPASPPKSPPSSPPKSPPSSPPGSPPMSPPQPPDGVLPACAPPDVRTPPEFRLPYRHPVNLKEVFVLPPVLSPPLSTPQFACADVPSLSASVAFDPRYEQLWSLQKLAIGDLASTLNLAPLERLVIEVKTSQRTTLERSAVDSSESLESTEATLHDTDTMNVARSNTTTTNWHVDGQGSISAPLGASGLTGNLGISGGYSKNVTNTSQYSQNRISERTQKSANSLKTLHKVEIKGASESIVQDRQLRTLRNPYRDRALALNFFQLLKHFDVTTSLVESRVSIVIEIGDITMDPSFVIANVDFLTQNLIDDDLRGDLASAVAGARASARLSDQTPATLAQKALQFLFFNPPNMFDLPAFGTISAADANNPGASYTAAAAGNLNPGTGASAFRDVLYFNSGGGTDDNRPFAKVFFTLNFFYRLVVEAPPPPGTTTLLPLDPFNNGENAIQLALGLYNAINDDWNTAVANNPQGFKNVLDNLDRTEGIRRVAGFLSMVGKMLLPLIASLPKTTTTETPDSTTPTNPPTVVTVVEVSDEETPRQKNKRVLDALIQHLRCNKNFYIQRFLEYQARRTRGQAVTDFATSIWSQFIAALPSIDGIRNNIVDFDPAAAFVDKQTIVIPDRPTAPVLSPVASPTGLTGAQLVQVGQQLGVADSPPTPVGFPAPTTVQLQVPADGVHLEVAGGACILQDVPDKPFVQADLNIGASSVSITEE